VTVRTACGDERRRGARRWAALWRRLAESGGYSLVELIVTLAILTIVIGALTQLIVSGTNAQLDLTKRFEAQQDARLALDALRREIHCASALANPSAAYPSSLINVTLGSACTRSAGQTVTWCTLGSGSRYALRRVFPALPPGSGCSGGVKKADYLTAPGGAVFTGYISVTGQRRKLSVRLPVDTDPRTARATYILQDDIVLRNSPRT
jgi:prepilin-type N-terminal cleavage/methylation domain-containing protein